MTAKDLDDTLKAIAANAKAMRDAGVTGDVVIGDISFTIANDDAPVVTIPVVSEKRDPIDDPDTFGTEGIPRRRVPLREDMKNAAHEFASRPDNEE